LLRFQQDEFEPLDEDGRTFLTDGWMQRRLRDVGARCKGEGGSGGDPLSLCERDSRGHERGKEATAEPELAGSSREVRPWRIGFQSRGRERRPTLVAHSYWWRVFRIVPLSAVLRVTAHCRALNPRRRHSSLGMLSPIDYEQQHQQEAIAA